MADRITHDELQAWIRQICDEKGLYVYHTANSIGADKGWPDLVIIGRRVLFRELKSATGVLSSEQTLVGWRLKAAGQDWAVWWPKDLANGNIRRQLQDITP